MNKLTVHVDEPQALWRAYAGERAAQACGAAAPAVDGAVGAGAGAADAGALGAMAGAGANAAGAVAALGATALDAIESEYPDYAALRCVHAFARDLGARLREACAAVGGARVALEGTAFASPTLRLAVQAELEGK